jgi:predicted AAA+ superfamily ATPase
VPELLSHIKVRVDKAQIDSQFILTGSNQFTMMKGISQSLAGRTAIFNLLPFSWGEIYSKSKPDLNEAMYKGFYPRLIDKGMNPAMYYNSYISTYLDKDIRLLSNVQDLNLFNKFLALCAGRTGSLLNKTALANETGIDVKTVNNWLSLLQTSFIIYLLQPWHNNINKRLVKAPKLYFYDTGLVSRLMRIRNAEDMINHPLRGQIFETFVIGEYVKSFYNKGMDAPLYFYRESNGTEIDLIIQNGLSQTLIEIKSAQTINPSFYKNILSYRKEVNNDTKAVLVYGGETEWEHHNILNKPYNSITNPE